MTFEDPATYTLLCLSSSSILVQIYHIFQTVSQRVAPKENPMEHSGSHLDTYRAKYLVQHHAMISIESYCPSDYLTFDLLKILAHPLHQPAESWISHNLMCGISLVPRRPDPDDPPPRQKCIHPDVLDGFQYLGPGGRMGD